METDIEKFYEKGQAAAGTRVRKALSELKKLSQDMRNEVQALKNERKG
ncbi:MAG: histone H1 [Ignavibacteriales bacterium]|nr:histone H1 [Ignavibacteriales bacterium]